ncbi:MAG: hypothetical protein H8D78_07115 [Chloroflexi bacterium]|nr:hypothetical protein [Chloroflexota bacterium]
MTTPVSLQIAEYEQVLISAVRTLRADRAAQLADFARFLAAQALAEEIVREENAAEVEADEARWDELLATEEAQAVLEKLADEALAEHRAGRTRPMIFTEDGRIALG